MKAPVPYQKTSSRADRAKKRAWVFVCAVSAALLMGGGPALAQQVAVIVNGEPITTYDIQQRSKFLQLATHKEPSRQEVLEELINDKLKVQEAKHWKLEITQTEVDTAFANMGKRMHFSSEQFKQALAQSGVDADTLKARIRAEIAWAQIVRGRYASTLQVGDKDVRDALQAQAEKQGQSGADNNSEPKNADNKDEPSKKVGSEYTLRPILFIIPRGASPPATEERKREAEALRTRFDSCDTGLTYARSLRYVAVRDQIIKSSSDLIPALRQILDTTPVGHLTPPEVTDQGVQVFAICSKKETLSDTPEQRDARDKVFAQKFEQQSKRYLAELHRSAMIEVK
jgi:peptidyl-prolyl cis-trans isomerase SurA